MSWGDGTIAFQGKEYPITLSGLSLLDLGVSSVSATGKVYSMNKLSDLSGNYIASQATFAVAGGSGELTMINDKGVVITLASEQSGTQLTAGPAGMSIKLIISLVMSGQGRGGIGWRRGQFERDCEAIRLCATVFC